MPPQDASEPSAAAAKITVTRNSPDDVQQRQVIVYLDGEQVGELLFGDSLALPVSAGHHELRVDNTWNHKDLHLEVNAGDDLQFLAKSTSGEFSKFLLVAFGAGPIYVSIEPVPPSP